MDNKSCVIKDDQGFYYITCATCGKKAVSFGAPQIIRSVVDEAFVSILDEEHFLYQGIICSQYIPVPSVAEVKNRLDTQDLKDLDFYF